MNFSFDHLNKRPQFTIPTGRLRIAPYDIEMLLEVEIHQKINEHSTFYLKGLLAKSNQENYAELLAKETQVTLSAVDESEEECVLFQGIVKSVEIQVVKETRYIEVQAVSYSYLLDIEQKKRSFQNKDMQYAHLIRQVTGAYEEAEVIDAASSGAPTNQFLVQYLETDWEFMKRLASHFQTGLVCDVRFDSPKYFFGIPIGQTLTLDSDDYFSVRKDLRRFSLLSNNGVGGLSENDFICYEVDTNYVARVGDKVIYRQQPWCVSEIVSTADSGTFVSRLFLMPQKGLSQLPMYNKYIAGASFGGHIIETKNDRVKVSLDMDSGHNPGEPCFFPYSTIYSSQDGSGWYCMPETGDTVRIYCPDSVDDHAYAISSVHEEVDPDMQHKADGADSPTAGGGGGGYSGQRDDPSVKSFCNSAGMEIRLTPDGVYIISDGATITLTEDGIVMMSENDIVFKSQKNIIINAEQEISIVGTAEVGLSSESTTVLLKDDMEIVGQEVKAN